MTNPNENVLPDWLSAIPVERRADAEDRLRRYLKLAFAIVARLEAEERDGTLTVVEYGPTLNGERSNKPITLRDE